MENLRGKEGPALSGGTAFTGGRTFLGSILYREGGVKKSTRILSQRREGLRGRR